MDELHPIYDAKLSSTEISVFDLETTGLSSSKNRIIQVAIVQIAGGQIVDDGWDQFVHPGEDHLPLTDIVSNLTGITEADLEGQPDMSLVIEEFDQRVGMRFVAGHNVAGFDLKFMRKAEERHDAELQLDYYVDTLKLMRKLHPDLDSHNLASSAAHYGLEVDSDSLHNALVDTRLTAALLLKQIDELKDKGVETFDQMLNFLTG